jgi:uncharacterized membrane protein
MAVAETEETVNWVELLLKLSHVVLAILLLAGIIGRWILLSRAARTDDVEHAHLLADAAAPFERIAQLSGPLLLVFGVATAWAQDYPWLGLTTGWMALSVLLVLPILAMIPTIFIPRGRIFEAAMAEARAAGHVTDALQAAWADPAVALARRYELAAVALIVALMVLKPF